MAFEDVPILEVESKEGVPFCKALLFLAEGVIPLVFHDKR
jgi:hypothetical protein